MDQTADDPPPAPQEPEEAVRRRRWWLGALIFIGGIVAGVLGTGLLVATTPDFGAVQVPADRASASSSINPVEVTAQAQVNAACLRVINDSQDVYQIITGVGDAAAELDFQRLDDIVRRLQPIEPRLARDLRECRVDTSFTGGPPPSDLPPGQTPTPTPGGEPTTPGSEPTTPGPVVPSPTGFR